MHALRPFSFIHHLHNHDFCTDEKVTKIYLRASVTCYLRISYKDELHVNEHAGQFCSICRMYSGALGIVYTLNVVAYAGVNPETTK